MIKHGCKYCNNLENIKPAKYIKEVDALYKKWIENAKLKKKFIMRFNFSIPYAIVNVCPKCNHVFTEEDYDAV